MFKKDTNNLLNISMMIIVFYIIFYILYIWAKLIIPFIIALLLSFAIIWLSNFFKKILILIFSFFHLVWSSSFLKKYKIQSFFLFIPSFFSFILSLSTYIFIWWLLWKMIGSNFEDLIRLLPDYQTKVILMITQVFNYLHIPIPVSISEILWQLDLQKILLWILSWFTTIFSNAWIILFYVLFILLEYRYFKEKLNLMIIDNLNRQHIFETIDKIKRDVKSYFVIKTVVSLITAILSYVVMKLFQLDFALFWALLIFILNFIPNIGSIIAVLLASLFSLIQFDSYTTFFLIISWLSSIQILMWNIIEPKFMWNKLNLSPLVIIISLWFWWAIWWIVWMLLSVPIMVIINIILAKIPATRSIAILLSEKWDLQIDWGKDVIQIRKKVINTISERFIKK